MPVEILSSSGQPGPADGPSSRSTASAVSPDGRKEPSGIQDGGGQVAALRTVCSWCEAEGITTIITDGPTDAEGRSSHGICAACSAREIARIREARAHLLPLYITRQEPAGTYRVEDRKGQMLARALPGSGIASAMAVRLEELTKSGEGWCPRHVPTMLREGRCFACALGHEPSQWSVAK